MRIEFAPHNRKLHLLARKFRRQLCAVGRGL